MSFNIRYDNPDDGDNRWTNRRAACARLLDEQNPDIVGFQEVLASQLQELQEDMPEYAWMGVGRDDGKTAGEYAPIFYNTSRYEPVREGTFWLSETPDEVSQGWDAAAKRIVTWAELRGINEQTSFFVFNTHFDHKGKVAREMSAKLLAKRAEDIAGLESMVFVTGDLNTRLSNPALEALRSEFFDARQSPVTDNTRTFNAFGGIAGWFAGQIDFVLYRDAQVEAFKTIEDSYGVAFVSDHYPVMAEFVY